MDYAKAIKEMMDSDKEPCWQGLQGMSHCEGDVSNKRKPALRKARVRKFQAQKPACLKVCGSFEEKKEKASLLREWLDKGEGGAEENEEAAGDQIMQRFIGHSTGFTFYVRRT